MKRSTLIAAAAGAVLVLAASGAALAAAADSGSGAVTVTASPSPTDLFPSPEATDDFSSSPEATDDSSPFPEATDDDNGRRGDGSLDDDGPRATSTPSTKNPATGGITAAQAGRIALAAAGGGRIVRIEAEREHGRAVWDVRVMNGSVRHDIDVDRATGGVNRHKSDDKD